MPIHGHRVDVLHTANSKAPRHNTGKARGTSVSRDKIAQLDTTQFVTPKIGHKRHTAREVRHHGANGRKSSYGLQTAVGTSNLCASDTRNDVGSAMVLINNVWRFASEHDGGFIPNGERG